MSFRSTAAWFENFDEPEQIAPYAEPEPEKITFDAAELSAARAEAWNDGYLAASRADAQAMQRNGQAILEQLMDRLLEVEKKLEQLVEQSAASVTDWLVDSFLTTLPGLSDRFMAERTDVVGKLLKSALILKPRIELHRSQEPVACFADLAELSRQLEAEQGPDHPAGKIVIAWQQGEAQLDRARLWDDIRAAILPLKTAGQGGDLPPLTAE